MKNWNISEQAKRLHQDALVWDNHICLPHNNDEKWMRELKRHKKSGGASIWPEGFGYDSNVKIVAPEVLPEITEALLSINYSDADVRKVLGENLLRVAKQVWRQ